MITRKEAETILALAIQSPGADELFVSLTETDATVRGVAGQRLQPPHQTRNLALAVTARRGKRYALASGNIYQDNDIRNLVERAASLATHMPEAPGILPFPGPLEVAEAPLRHGGNDTTTWKELTRAVETFRNDTSGTLVYGSVSLSSTVLALASSNGLFAYQPSSLAHAQFRCYASDGTSTGFDERYHIDPAALAPADVLRSAAESCLRWSDPVEIAPRRITTIFEPRALAELMQPMLRQFSSRAITQDQSFLRRLDGSSFLGTALFDPRVTLRSDPFDTRLPSMPFTAEGEAVRPEFWVKDGVIAQLVIDRHEAAASSVMPVAPPTNLIMDATEPVADLVADTKYGLLVKGFANLNILDPKNCLLTGSTRDGVFLIEDGKITKPVRNLVLRETPVYLFKEVLAFGVPQPVSPTGSYFPMLLPPVKVKDVMYTQVSGLI